MDSDAANTNSGGNREGKDMSQTVKTLISEHSSLPGSNELNTSTFNTDGRNESCRTNEAVTSAQSANSLTAIGRCRCGRDFVATLTLDSIHKPTLEGTMPHLETPSQVRTTIQSKRRRVDNVVDQIFGTPESRELALINNDNKLIPNRSKFVNGPYNISEVSESQGLSNSNRHQRKQRFDESTNINLKSVQWNTESNCYRPVNTQSPGAIGNLELMNPQIMNGFDEVPLQHGQLQTGQSPSVNCMGNDVPDQPFSPVMKRETSSAPPSGTTFLDSRYRETDNVAINPRNNNLTPDQHLETHETNSHDNINIHWINDMNNLSGRGNISANDRPQTKPHLPVEYANTISNNGTGVESNNTQSESAVQIVDATVQNNNPYQCFASGYAHRRIRRSTLSPQSLIWNGNPSRSYPSNASATRPKTRKTKYLSKYLVNWEKEANVRLCWLTKGREEGNAYCLVCKRDILIKHMGKSAVLQHVKGKQHRSRITQIEINLRLIQSGALQIHLNMSDYRIPAHENVMSDRTQNTELAMREQGKREQQGVILPDEGREEWTARCNCGQTEGFFQRILNVSDGEEYIQMMSGQTYTSQIPSELNGVAGMMYDNSELHATTYQSFDSSDIEAPSNRNSLSFYPSLSTDAYLQHIDFRNSGQRIDVEMANPDGSYSQDHAKSESTHKFIQ